MCRIQTKDTLQQFVELGRDGWENGRKKLVRLVCVSGKGGVFHGGLAPWVAPSDEIDQNHTQAPNVVLLGAITFDFFIITKQP